MNTAERSSLTQADAARSGGDAVHSQSGSPSLETDVLDASAADRYALAFRPSWAPLVQEPQPAAARVEIESAASIAHKGLVERDPHEPLSLAGAGKRRRGALLAGACVLSFVGLVYWGVSSSTPAAPQHVVQPAKAAKVQPQAAAPLPAAEPAATAVAEPSPPPFPTPAPADDLSALAARPEAPADAPAIAAEAAPEQASVAADPAGPTTTASAETAASPAATETPIPTEPAPVAEKVAAAEPTAPAAPSPAPATPVVENAAAPAPVAATPVAAVRQPPAPSTPSVAPTPAPTKQPTAPLAAAPAQPQPIASAQTRTLPPEPAPQTKRLPLLSVRALPEGARLFLDGQRLPNPFDMRLPEGGKHKLEARLEGYETSTQTVRTESDAKLTITLKRVGGAGEPTLQVRPLNQQQHTRGAGFVTSNPY